MPKTKPSKAPSDSPDHAISDRDLARIEFHRNAIALLPEADEKTPGVATALVERGFKITSRSCTCEIARKRTCAHVRKLTAICTHYHKQLGKKSLEEDFRASIWYLMASVFIEDCRDTPAAVKMITAPEPDSKNRDANVIKVFNSRDEEMLTYLSQGADRSLFIERCAHLIQTGQAPYRSAILRHLKNMTITESERDLSEMGRLTRRQVLEASFWYQMAYHGYLMFGNEGVTFHASIEKETGQFTAACRNSDGELLLRLVVPRLLVKRLLNTFKKVLHNHHGLTIHPIPFKSIFNISMNHRLDLEVRPMIQMIQKNGETRYLSQAGLEKFRYGTLIYVSELDLLAEFQPPNGDVGQLELGSGVMNIIKKAQVPSFLADSQHTLEKGPFKLDASVRQLQVFKKYDRVEIMPVAANHQWCWLSVEYGFGNRNISLADIMAARADNERFLPVADGWVDCQTLDLGDIDALFKQQPDPSDDLNKGAYKISRTELLRLQAMSLYKADIRAENKKRSQWFRRFLDGLPESPPPTVKGMTSPLRPYQEHGVQWLWYLHENALGGLLCDDMGLGKTHEVMAFMLCLRQTVVSDEPFMVVCPTTVLSHWESKLRKYAPNLKIFVFHGPQRRLPKSLAKIDVLLTSYGILLRDVAKLREIPFYLAVFDEIQYLKNAATQSYMAAASIQARMKAGLTGTPVENSVNDLKALMDLIMPGYLGSNIRFKRRYGASTDPDGLLRKELHRLIAPFTLRRLKSTVLSELPEKIEDLRICELSEDQVKFYRDAVSSRADNFIQTLQNTKKKVPYIHIFALLNLLKKICNHPMLLDKGLEIGRQYQSGKWDLFKELLAESLASGQKVVIFSHYLGMIDLIERHLNAETIPFVKLIGKTQKRGEIVEIFNTDPVCRVFLGSLKAGGTGIDLVAASVVIHYDRWWNAAKEDQATDRVHRIGQTRGVQVIKIVTRGTLEERIATIIERKRQLMESIIQVDDPGFLKTFSREELIDLLAMPEADRGN